MTLDGANTQYGSPTSAGFSPVLASWHNLSITQEHIVALTTIPSGSTGNEFHLERADVTVDTGVP